ncbi:hypothetical protein AVEN_179686-1 [Araneus ventricosus]|uniref:Endonuclease/exonuclease/phosphatase domain-containing protein n=1 Tax=Araneus ventricosus TaxID=182803 RepID=A0A4Y2T7Y6_ARAVE|nr:hypothetical protein AVEN_179686-1 [Araneus ventricosus]
MLIDFARVDRLGSPWNANVFGVLSAVRASTLHSKINVNHSQIAHVSALQTAIELGLDFLTIQEPYLINGEPLNSCSKGKIYCSKSHKSLFIILNPELIAYTRFKTDLIIILELHLKNLILNISSVYFPPHDNIDDSINEFLTYDFNIITGDFNCLSQTWGYNREDHRGRKLMKFLTLNNLNICNIKEHGPTFISDCLKTRYPDLTVVSSALIDKVKQWGILDRHSFSDHRYIYFKLNLEFQPSTEFYLKTGYGPGKFLRGLKPHMEPLTRHLNSVHCFEDIDSFFVEFIDIVSELAMGIFKKKPNRRRGGFKFWNDGLRTLRNTTNKLYKIFKRKKQSDSPEADVQAARADYYRSRAIYKKQLLIAKRESWVHFCKNYTHTFGSIFKMALEKAKKGQKF